MDPEGWDWEQTAKTGAEVLLAALMLAAGKKVVTTVKERRARRNRGEEIIMMEEGEVAEDGGEIVEEGAAADNRGGNSNEVNIEHVANDGGEIVEEGAADDDGGGNSNEVNIEDEVNDDMNLDEATIEALVIRLPRKLTNPQNTRLKQSKTEPKMDSSAVDTTKSVIEAILLNQGGIKFSESENSNAREMIVEVKRQLAWRLKNKYRFKKRHRERFWEILLKLYPEAFEPKGKNDAFIKPVMDALVQGQPIEVVFTATCSAVKCKHVMGTFKYKFSEAPCAYSLNVFQRGIPNLEDKLPEIIQKSLKQISLPAAKKIRCPECRIFGAKISPIEPSHLKIPNVLIINFAEGDGNQEMYPIQLTEEFSLNEGETIYKLASVVMFEGGHYYNISKIRENTWYNFDDIKKDPAEPFPSFHSAFMMEKQDMGRNYILNNEKENLGCAVLYVVYTSDAVFIGDHFQDNYEAPSLPSIITEDIFLDESDENLNFPPRIALQVVDNNDQHQVDQRSVSEDVRGTPTPKKRILERFLVDVSETGSEYPNITETPRHFSELLETFEQNLREGVTEVPYGPEHFKFILEVVNRKDKPFIVHFKGNMKMKNKYATNFSDFDQNKNLSYWAEQRKHFPLDNNHIGIQVLSFKKNKKITLKDVLKIHKSNEFTVLSVIPWTELGDKPSPFDDSFWDPNDSILSNASYFGEINGITKATTEVTPAGSMLPMHTEVHFASALNFNHGPGVKLWVVIESKFTLKAGEILGKHKFEKFYGVCCWTFCHRDVVFNLERENIPFKEILQHPGDSIYLPPGTLHMVTNISENMSESLNIITKKDLPLCRSFKVCETHQETIEIAGKDEMNHIFEEFKMNRIENFIYFADDQRDRKLRAIGQLKNSGDPVLKDLEQSIMVSHKVSEILEAYEDARTGGGVGSFQDGATEEEQNLVEIHQSTMQNTEENMNWDSMAENAGSAAILNQPENFIFPDLNGGGSSQVPTQIERESESENENYPEHVEAVVQEEEDNIEAYYSANEDVEEEFRETHNSEPAVENTRSSRGEDNEEDFRQIINGQNILKSSTTSKFRCLCQCQPPIISENFIKCYKHMKNHQVEIIIPAEKCARCGEENKSVFKMIHTCALKPYKRKKRHWGKSGK